MHGPRHPLAAGIVDVTVGQHVSPRWQILALGASRHVDDTCRVSIGDEQIARAIAEVEEVFDGPIQCLCRRTQPQCIEAELPP